MSPSTATGVSSRLSAPRDCQEPRIETSYRLTLMTPASGVAMYAMPYLVATCVTMSESNPSSVVMTSIRVFVEVLMSEMPDSWCPTTRVFELLSKDRLDTCSELIPAAVPWKLPSSASSLSSPASRVPTQTMPWSSWTIEVTDDGLLT